MICDHQMRNDTEPLVVPSHTHTHTSKQTSILKRIAADVHLACDNYSVTYSVRTA